MASGRKQRPIQDRFDAAVTVIKSLPKEGPFQPSNTVKLRFYALYKQSKEGPCTSPKPSFWDAVGRAKWEAWSVCGKMSADLAMQMYVEELQQLVETMPQTPEVERFLESIGPYISEGDDPGPAPIPVQAQGASEEERGGGGGSPNGGDSPDNGDSPGVEEEEEVERDHPPQPPPSSSSSPPSSSSSSSAAAAETSNGVHGTDPKDVGLTRTESDDEDSDAFQESFQELPTFPQGVSGSSQGGHTSAPPPPPPVQVPRVGFILPPGGQAEPDSAVSARTQRESDSNWTDSNEGRNAAVLEGLLPQLLSVQNSFQSTLQQVTALISSINTALPRLHPQPHPPQPPSPQNTVQSRRWRVLLKLVPFLLSWPLFHILLVRSVMNRFGTPSSTWWLFSLVTFIHTMLAAGFFTIFAQMIR